MATETTTMQAGPELDALVAEKVMGWKRHRRNTAWWVDADEEEGIVSGVRGLTCGTDRWSPSTKTAAAWEVVEHVSRERKVWFSISYAHPALADTGMEHESCSVMVHPIGSIKSLADATAATFAEAVCRAALAAARPRT